MLLRHQSESDFARSVIGIDFDSATLFHLMTYKEQSNYTSLIELMAVIVPANFTTTMTRARRRKIDRGVLRSDSVVTLQIQADLSRLNFPSSLTRQPTTLIFTPPSAFLQPFEIQIRQ